MQIRLNYDWWWSELGFDKFYLMGDLSFENLEGLNILCERLSEGLDYIMNELYDFLRESSIYMVLRLLED